jgi:thiol-disulfide isomerase/thioredoxin
VGGAAIEPGNLWQRLRARFWASLVFDVLLIAAAFYAVHAWQTRDLPIDRPAPATVLSLLDGGAAQSAIREGEAGIVYFFAPWCRVCRASIDNLDDLVADGRIAWATTVALDYADAAEVRAFIERTGVTLPVLMGDAETAADWSIRGFPTYYVIDAEGRIHSRSVGYSTWVGMWFRAWRAAGPSRDAAGGPR